MIHKITALIPGIIGILALVQASGDSYYHLGDFSNVQKVDAHTHLFVRETAFAEQAREDGFDILDVNVDVAGKAELAEQKEDALFQQRAFPRNAEFLTAFSMDGFLQPGWFSTTIARLKQDFEDGALGIKIWKNIGMTCRDSSGRFIMIDDPRFDSVIDFVIREGKTVLGHLGEPKNCWLPVDQMTVLNDRRYYQAHPEYHMYLHPGFPSYEQQIAARDRFLERHPDLRFVAAHLGSLEWNVDELAKRFDRFPNMAADVTERLSHLQYQSQKDWKKVRDFVLRYQDRLIYGTDATLDSNATDKQKFRERLHSRWIKDWEYFVTDDTMQSENVRGADRWGYTGVGGGGAMFYPAISPHDTNLVFVACDMGGSYVTYDGGRQWRMFNLVNRVRSFVFDPVDSNVVYAVCEGLFKSRDKGMTWELLYPQPLDVIRVISKGDHAEERLVTKDSIRKKLLAFAVDPASSVRLYAGIEEKGKKGLYISEDGGRHWRKERDIPQGARTILVDPGSAAGDRTLYIADDKGIVQKKHGIWRRFPGPDKDAKALEYSGGWDKRAGKYCIYGLWGQDVPQGGAVRGIYVSRDGGSSWQRRDKGIMAFARTGGDGPLYRAVSACSTAPGIAYVSYSHLRCGGDTVCSGVARTDDYGRNWKLVWQDTVFPGGMRVSRNFGRDWINERFGVGWGENPLCLGVSPSNPAICYGTDFGRTIRTQDGGKTWEGVYSTLYKDAASWSSRGLEVTTNYDIVSDPFDSLHLYLLYTDIGLFESHNGGISWRSATRDTAIPEAWTNTCYSLVLDPKVKGRAWAAMSGIHDLPRPKMFRRNGVKNFNGGIVRTEDGGRSWRVVSAGVGQGAVTGLLLDTAREGTGNTLYACVFGKGVFKSVDGGETWLPKNKGIEGAEPFAWRIVQRGPHGSLFLIVSRRSEDGRIGDEGDGALYRSDDNAETWRKIALPPGTNGPTSLLTSEKDPATLILSAWGRVSGGEFSPDTGGGIFISHNDGVSWEESLVRDQHISDLTFDPRVDRLYACGFNGSAYYSEDGAKSWVRIRGYNFKWGRKVTPDPADVEKVYIMTFGGGVWHGPAKGDANAPEDIITPLYNR
ncbi:MAG: hypothetical protein BGO55_04535 [Sphingobacteriales bacterium 50-39]|nr:amidohydrolase family protein [Sphingobacteriales bacterium]OJW55890.1 MAG: hypothetical protein BGO55_04535 [Sphingobacteriales bacterium 50-39]